MRRAAAQSLALLLWEAQVTSVSIPHLPYPASHGEANSLSRATQQLEKLAALKRIEAPSKDLGPNPASSANAS